jgi:Secretion system C-terminal sorting domain
MNAPGTRLFSIYPNPSRGEITFSRDVQNPLTTQGIIQIVNLKGQVVRRIYITTQQRIDIEFDDPGIYFIQLITSKQTSTQVLTVMKE